MEEIRFIDLFAGIGGIRLGFEQAVKELGLTPKCVFTSEIKTSAKKVYSDNFPNEVIHGDITKIETTEIPDFDFLLGGFPCQAFSIAGNRGGFADTRGTLFFEIERILKEKQPMGFLLENVDGLVIHDREKGIDSKIGRTLSTILERLTYIGYNPIWKVIDSADLGVPQHRRRIYIIGLRSDLITNDDMSLIYERLYNFEKREVVVNDILEHGLPTSQSEFVKKLLSKYSVSELNGKMLTDKRGGKNNIHSWDLVETTPKEKQFLDTLLHMRRRKQWAEEIGVEWQDGMPLNLQQIKTFWHEDDTEEMLEHLVSLKVLKKDYPKRLVNVDGIMKRVKDTSLEIGYNVVTVKFRNELYRILDKNTPSQTLVATDAKGLYVTDGDGLRRLTHKECLRLFGFPDSFKYPSSLKDNMRYKQIGNSVVVPLIERIMQQILKVL